MRSSGHWIWLRNEPSFEKKVCLFKKAFYINRVPESFWVNVTADSSYCLYINGRQMSEGPCRGDTYRKYYDHVDIAGALKPGMNIIAASVVYFPTDGIFNLQYKTGPTSIITSSRGGFCLFEDSNNQESFGIGTDMTWQVKENKAYSFIEAVMAKYAGDMEYVDGNRYPFGWQVKTDDDCTWQQAVIVSQGEGQLKGGVVNHWNMKERAIPYQYKRRQQFDKIVRSSSTNIPWENLIHGKELIVNTGKYEWVEIDAGELTTAYIKLMLNGTKGSRVKITYAESYVKCIDSAGNAVKEIRDKADGAFFIGESDEYLLCTGDQYYSPLFYRTFRFIKIELFGEEPIRIDALEVFETGYPIDIKGEWHSDGDKWQCLWDISVRTLRRCMHDTYIDCPYYEQMQYTMDTMLQMLFTYQLTDDDRLARKAIYDFHSSLMPDGMITCNAPAKFRQIIPGFSIYWIMMLRDHYQYHGDVDMLRIYLPTAHQIINYFLYKIDDATGLVKNVGYWQFVDWTFEWAGKMGAPIEDNESYNLIYNLMLVSGLKIVAQLNLEIGRSDVYAEMAAKASEITESILKYGWSKERQLFKDTPDDERFSQHAQIWAVLGEIVQGAAARELMEQCLQDTTLTKCSYSMSFFFFRALEKVGLYERSQVLWKTWFNLCELNITTWPEDPVSQRSDCHAWGAVPIYEYAACILGVQPCTPGYRKIRIRPDISFMQKAEGKVATVHGVVCVKWWKDGGQFHLEVQLPIENEVEIVLPDGTIENIAGMHYYKTVKKIDEVILCQQ